MPSELGKKHKKKREPTLRSELRKSKYKRHKSEHRQNNALWKRAKRRRKPPFKFGIRSVLVLPLMLMTPAGQHNVNASENNP